MRIVKARLIDMMPEANVFLDVDDLQRKKGKGAELVDGSQVFLLFCSQGFFTSPNCMREVLRGILREKPFLLLLEPDEMHGRCTIEEAKHELHELEKQNKYAEWGLDKEYAEWVQSTSISVRLGSKQSPQMLNKIPAADDIASILFKRKAISW